jgi:predicted nucleic-acid-binding Zn-ribbon protein
MTNYAPCPRCNNTNAERLKFTWWGGALGPKLLTHVRCSGCGYKYNGKTGKDNTTGIVLYFVIAGALAFILMFVIFAAFALMQFGK